MTDDTTLTDADLERLEQIRREYAKRGTPKADLEAIERGRHNADHRRPRLPSDLACYRCGGAIPTGERCRGVVDGEGLWGTNKYGGFSRGQAARVVCQECVDDA